MDEDNVWSIYIDLPDLQEHAANRLERIRKVKENPPKRRKRQIKKDNAEAVNNSINKSGNLDGGIKGAENNYIKMSFRDKRAVLAELFGVPSFNTIKHD